MKISVFLCLFNHSFLLRIMRFRSIVCWFVCAMLACSVLTGCGSSRKGVKKTAATAVSGKKNRAKPPRDYSKEFVDPMGLAIVEEAREWLGTRYAYGGSTRKGTDCSGLVMEVYREVCGVRLPRTTRDQKAYCTEIARNRAHVGDLVFFTPGRHDGRISHVGVYIGKGEMIHASSSRGVMVSSIDDGYWSERYHSTGRVPGSVTAFERRGKKVKRGKNREAVEPSPAVEPANEITVPKTETTIDLLDLMIDQAVDSIFAVPEEPEFWPVDSAEVKPGL